MPGTKARGDEYENTTRVCAGSELELREEATPPPLPSQHTNSIAGLNMMSDDDDDGALFWNMKDEKFSASVHK
jgi:hypothetical protein